MNKQQFNAQVQAGIDNVNRLKGQLGSKRREEFDFIFKTIYMGHSGLQSLSYSFARVSPVFSETFRTCNANFERVDRTRRDNDGVRQCCRIACELASYVQQILGAMLAVSNEDFLVIYDDDGGRYVRFTVENIQAVINRID